MADAIVDIPTQYYTAFPADTGAWTNAPLGDSTKLQLMHTALTRGSQVLPAEVDAVCVHLLGLPLSGVLAVVTPPTPQVAVTEQDVPEGPAPAMGEASPPEGPAPAREAEAPRTGAGRRG